MAPSLAISRAFCAYVTCLDIIVIVCARLAFKGRLDNFDDFFKVTKCDFPVLEGLFRLLWRNLHPIDPRYVPWETYSISSAPTASCIVWPPFHIQIRTFIVRKDHNVSHRPSDNLHRNLCQPIIIDVPSCLFTRQARPAQSRSTDNT